MKARRLRLSESRMKHCSIMPSGSRLDQQVKEDERKTEARREIEESKKI
jgi:hypothetical protein